MATIYSSSSYYNSSREMGNISLDTNEIEKLIHSKGLYEQPDIEWYTKFNRFGCLDPYNALNGTREYIFFTKPDLHLFEKGTNTLNKELAGIPFFEDAALIYPGVMKQLQLSNRDNISPFMNLLTNSVNNSLDLPSIDADVIETGSTYQGFNIAYRQASFESDFHPEFSLSFDDSKWIEVYMLCKIYDEYEKAKKDGVVTPPNIDYILKRRLHDQFAVYKIIVDDDGESIIHYSKIWGVTIKNVPREAFGNLSNDGLKLSINFRGALVRDMQPQIITAFNKLVGVTDFYQKNDDKDILIYDTNIDSINGEWVKTPYINTYEVHNWGNTTNITGKFPRYKLRWR